MSLIFNNVEVDKVIYNGVELDEIWCNGVQVYVSTIFVPKPTANTTSFTYNTGSQGPSFENYDAAAMDLDGTPSAVGAGNYSVTFRLKKGYAWIDGTTDDVTIDWVINRLVIGIPYLSGTAYACTGGWVGPAVYGADYNWINQSGTTSMYWIGGAYVYWDLKDPNNTCWSDGTTGQKNQYWYTYAGTIYFNVERLFSTRTACFASSYGTTWYAYTNSPLWTYEVYYTSGWRRDTYYDRAYIREHQSGTSRAVTCYLCNTSGNTVSQRDISYSPGDTIINGYTY